MHSHDFKILIIGDDGIGKSSLVRRYVYGDFSPQYVATAREDYIVRPRISDGSAISNRISLNICDTGGQAILDRLRPLCYSNADVIVICFSVVDPSSFKNITEKWMLEIQRHAQSGAYFLLIGTKADLRSDPNVLMKLSEHGLSPVTASKALKLAHKIGASYFESSAQTGKNVNEIFDLSLLLSESLHLTRPDRLKQRKRGMVKTACWIKTLFGLVCFKAEKQHTRLKQQQKSKHDTR